MEGHDDHGNPLRYPGNHDNEGDGNRLEGDISEPEVVMPDDGEQQNKRKYKRHIPHQIQQLEFLLSYYPHPSGQQRLELANRVGVEAKQVKFWFQNRRTQEKVRSEHLLNRQLREDNDRLRKENQLMNSNLVNPTSSDRGGPASSSFFVAELSGKEHHMKAEDAKLKDVIHHLLAVAESLGKPFLSSTFPSSCPISSSDVDFSGKQKSADMPPFVGYLKKVDIFEAAISAMDVLIKLSETPGIPLWTRTISGEKEVLKYEEYVKVFNGFGMRQRGTIAEASRHTAVVPMNSLAVVETLVDANKWIDAFPSIVANASIVETVSSSLGTRNGTLQLIDAEFQVLSPLVSVRQVRFLRFCCQHEGVWSIVDVSFEDSRHAGASFNCKRLPSGCILQDLPNGCCKVTWIEHLEHDGAGIHPLFHDVSTSGVVFGARRWVASLQRHCESLALVMRPSSYGIQISGMLLSASASTWLPVKQETLFNFLSDPGNRNEWDTLSNGRPVQEILNITKSQGQKNRVSILRANGVGSFQASMVLLQEAWTDASGSLIVYAPVDIWAINGVMARGDFGKPALLPSGFAIYPVGSSSSLPRIVGSFLTIGFQILLSTKSDAKAHTQVGRGHTWPPLLHNEEDQSCHAPVLGTFLIPETITRILCLFITVGHESRKAQAP